jgi:hypothetical protein
MKETTIFGTITPDGTGMKAVLSKEYKALLKMNAGQRIFINITVFPESGTELQKGYWRKVVLPKAQEGFRETGDDMTLDETHWRLRELCPETSGVSIEDELTKDQLRGLIEWTIRLCAKEFNIIVPEPR